MPFFGVFSRTSSSFLPFRPTQVTNIRCLSVFSCRSFSCATQIQSAVVLPCSVSFTRLQLQPLQITFSCQSISQYVFDAFLKKVLDQLMIDVSLKILQDFGYLSNVVLNAGNTAQISSLLRRQLPGA